ncbi:restriction endonuclease subunit S [Hahella sp. HN01]|uniref:restriction endonuclease subunit S n=1 Tax=Hahella sp. HN01 TaxID=2847262 RepID=UPI001C1EACB5|nr:restriction endonuclease subunit S [Hahella sp. HN01]MBU6951957.1 restriction endonuclease subunit S [Hahella sp. HN01]
MDAQQFLAEFGHIANALNGIVKLRELVLQLAISGRLVEQNSNDISSDELISVNKRNKRELIEKKLLKRTADPRSIQKKEQPWELPEKWTWVRLGAVTNYGDAPKVEFKDVTPDTWVLELEDIEKSSSKLLKKVFAHERKFKSTKNGFPIGAVLYGKLRPYLDKVLIADTEGVCSTEISPISFYENINAYYLRWYLKSPFFISYANGSTYGMNLPRLGTDSAREALFPFPPLEEQSRIVAKVDELMALCDQLEAQQQKRRTLQNHLRQATLQAVAASQSPHELQESWQRLQANFGQLFSAPEDVVAFKGLILDLAVSGNLSNIEHRHDSTGEQLLEAIAQRRIAWLHEAEDQEKKEAQTMLKKLRTQQVNLPEITLPEHWAWATFLQVSQAVVDCHNKTAPYVANGIHLVRTTDIRNGEMNLTNTKKITEETFDYWARRMPPKAGDIFFTREAPMGEAAIVPKNEKVCLGQRTMLIRLFPEFFNNRFLLYVIRSPSFQARMIEAAIGMTVKHLRVGGVEDLVVPVPPKPEQDAIVSIIDSLFNMCDYFEKQLSKKQRLAENLVTSSVSTLTGIAIEQEEEPMKAPQTELVAPVRLGTPPDVKDQAHLATILARHNGEMSAKDLWQRFGLDKTIDEFYAQLKTEVAHGWLLEPEVAEMREKAEN